MIIRFTLENYKSINQEVTFSMIAEPLRQRVNENVISTDFKGIGLLKAMIIHGANASGKSNLLQGLSFMKTFVLESAKSYSLGQPIAVDPYRLSNKSLGLPSKFEIEIIIQSGRYIYGFTADQFEVHSEYLKEVQKTKERILFERHYEEIFVDTNFGEGHRKSDFIRRNSLFLSTMALIGEGRISSEITNWFSRTLILTDYNVAAGSDLTAELLQRPNYKNYLLEIFKILDLNIDDIKIKTLGIDEGAVSLLGNELQEMVRKRMKPFYKITTFRKAQDQSNDLREFDLREESAGTQKIFAVIGSLITSITQGNPVFIDELDSKLHPDLVTDIIDLFCNNSNNVNGGQLIGISHQTNPLSHPRLRRDQMMLVSQNASGTEMKSVYSQDIRSDTSFEAQYRKGEFGAVPRTKMNQLKLFDIQINPNQKGLFDKHL